MRYLGNSDSMVVHDLRNEQTNCQISEVLVENRVSFSPDTLMEAKKLGYTPGEWCIG